MSAKSRITGRLNESPPAGDPVRSLMEVILGQIPEVRQGAPGGRIPAGFLIEAIPSTGYTLVESQSFSERIEWGFSGWSEA